MACCAPTLIQESGPRARRVEDKRAELLATPRAVVLDDEDVATIRAVGDNTGSMSLKGAGPQHEDVLPDRWPLSPELAAVARRWGIEPARDLSHLAPTRG